MYCMKCGKQVASDAKFCKYCGAKTLYGLSADDIKAECTELPGQPEINEEKSVPKKKRWMVFATVAAVLVLLAGLCFFAWRYRNRIQAETTGEIPAESPTEELTPEENGLQPKPPETSLKETGEQDTETEKNVEYRMASQTYQNMSSGESIRWEYLYDEKGNISQAVKSYSDGTSERLHYEYEYGENGAIIKESQYSENGVLILENLYGDDGTVSKINQYDSNGRLSTENFRDAKDGEVELISYLYGENGQLESLVEQDAGTGTTRQSVYSENGDIALTLESIRNSDGCVIKRTETEYFEQGEEARTCVYEFSYDSDGNMSGWTTDGNMYSWSVKHRAGDVVCGTVDYNEDGTVQMYPEEGYEAAGDEFVKSGTPRDRRRSYSEDVRDDAGNVVKTSWFNKSGELLYSYEYEYEKLEALQRG